VKRRLNCSPNDKSPERTSARTVCQNAPRRTPLEDWFVTLSAFFAESGKQAVFPASFARTRGHWRRFSKVTDFLTAQKSWFIFSKRFSRAGVAMPA
jgi:hypothetical protein